MANSGETINLKRIFHDRPRPRQKIGDLAVGSEVRPGGDYLVRLADLVEHAKRFAEPLPSGKPGTSEANFITPRRAVQHSEEGVLELGFFIYTAPDGNELSISASWYSPDPDQPRVRQESLSTRNFDDRIAAYRENSPEVLGRLEEALATYEQVAEQRS